MKKRSFTLDKLISTIILFSISLGIAGCADQGNGNAAGSTGQAGGQNQQNILTADNVKPKELRVLYAGVEANVDSVKYAADKYKDKTDINVIVDSFPQAVMREKLFVELSTQDPYYDVFLIDSPWGAAAAPNLLDLMPMARDEKITDAGLLAVDDFIPMMLAQCVYNMDNPSNPPMDFQLPEYTRTYPVDLQKLQEDGYGLIGLPFHPNVLVLGYREDYFNDETIKNEFVKKYGRKLEPPEDWDQFLQVAEFFTKAYNQNSPTEYGTTLMAKKHESLYTDWRTMIRSFGVIEIDENMNPQFNTDEGIRATQFYKDLVDKYGVAPPSALSSTWDDVTREFGSGYTAMAMNYHKMVLDPDIAAKGGKVGFAMVPGMRLKDGSIQRAPNQGTYILSVNKYSKNPRWAYDFILNATSPEWQKTYSKFLFHSSRVSYYKDEEVIKTRPEYWPTFYESLKIGYGRPRITDYVQYSETIQKEVSDFLSGKQDARTALDKAAKDVKKLF